MQVTQQSTESAITRSSDQGFYSYYDTPNKSFRSSMGSGASPNLGANKPLIATLPLSLSPQTPGGQNSGRQTVIIPHTPSAQGSARRINVVPQTPSQPLSGRRINVVPQTP